MRSIDEPLSFPELGLVHSEGNWIRSCYGAPAVSLRTSSGEVIVKTGPISDVPNYKTAVNQIIGREIPLW